MDGGLWTVIDTRFTSFALFAARSAPARTWRGPAAHAEAAIAQL